MPIIVGTATITEHQETDCKNKQSHISAPMHLLSKDQVQNLQRLCSTDTFHAQPGETGLWILSLGLEHLFFSHICVIGFTSLLCQYNYH
jgi:hypothetical protein